MKKILLISYYWPPAAGIVIRRVMTLAKYLPKYGFEPILLCAGGDTPWMNIEHNVDSPDIEVHRVDASDLNQLFGPERTPLSIRLQTALRATFRSDYMAEWADRALVEAERIIEVRDIDIVLVTSPPFSIQSIGARLKKKFPKIKYVADLRDWFYSFRRGNPILALRRMLAIPRAKRHLRKADLAVGITPGFEEFLSEIGIPHETIMLGFDCDIAEEINYKAGEEFRLVHTGSFPSTGQTPEFVLIAFDMACQKSIQFREKARLVFAGVDQEYIDSRTPRFAERPDNIRAFGHVSHEKAIEMQRSSDVNLLIVTIPRQLGGDKVPTGKFYEYIAARRPIFATCPPKSVLFDLITENELGVVCRNSPDEIELELLKLFQKWQSGKLPSGASREVAEKFRAEKMIEDYSRVLTELLK